ncbi:hypothetical protein [Clostridium sp. DL1XJH146]
MNKKNNIFNKEKFAELLDRAKGDRSINKYAEESAVSAAHISRFLRQMIDTAPTPETISRLSSKAYNDVSYRDLMAAAGHIAIGHDAELYNLENGESKPTSIHEKKSTIESRSPREYRREIDNLEKQFFQIVLSYLYEVPFKWNIQKPEERFRKPDMLISIEDENEKYSKWYIEFRVNLDERHVSSFMPYHFYGKLVTQELGPEDKYTIAVNSKRTYELFLKRPPKSLRGNLYVMLIDVASGEISQEEKLCDYYI